MIMNLLVVKRLGIAGTILSTCLNGKCDCV